MTVGHAATSLGDGQLDGTRTPPESFDTYTLSSGRELPQPNVRVDGSGMAIDVPLGVRASTRTVHVWFEHDAE